MTFNEFSLFVRSKEPLSDCAKSRRASPASDEAAPMFTVWEKKLNCPYHPIPRCVRNQ